MSISAEQLPTDPVTRQAVRLFLCGDVMTGRGRDQILSHPCDPFLHESYVKSARDYIRLAEQVNGRIPRAVKFFYICGAALPELTRAQPDARDDLTLMNFVDVDVASGKLLDLDMVPLQTRRFQHASGEDADLLLETLDRECRRFGARMSRKSDGRLALS